MSNWRLSLELSVFGGYGRIVIARVIKLNLSIVVLLIVVLPLAAQARGWLEVAGSYYNPDWEFRESESGLRLTAHLQLDHWYANASYNTTDTAFVNESVVRLRGLPFGNWRELTVGYSHALSQRSRVNAEMAWHGLSVYQNTRSGYALGASAQHRLSNRFAASLRVARLYDLERDWRLTGELLTTLTPVAELVVRIDDFAEFDFTWYEIGLRFHW